MNTQSVTTTQLREQSSKVVAHLSHGEDVTLIHRSKIIGIIKPLYPSLKHMDNLKEFHETLRELRPKSVISPRKREEIYSKYLKKRYGKTLS